MLPCSAGACHCGGFSCCRAWAPGCPGSAAVAHGLSSHSMWTHPEPGMEPVSPALASRFLTTGPPALQEEPVLLFKLVWMFKDFRGENWQGRRGSKNTNLTSNSKFLMGPTQPGPWLWDKEASIPSLFPPCASSSVLPSSLIWSLGRSSGE